MPRRVLTEEQMRQWLLENVRIRDDCRIWAGAVDSWGQPVVMWDGKNYKARRLLGRLLIGMAERGEVEVLPASGSRAAQFRRAR